MQNMNTIQHKQHCSNFLRTEQIPTPGFFYRQCSSDEYLKRIGYLKMQHFILKDGSRPCGAGSGRTFKAFWGFMPAKRACKLLRENQKFTNFEDSGKLKCRQRHPSSSPSSSLSPLSIKVRHCRFSSCFYSNRFVSRRKHFRVTSNTISFFMKTFSFWVESHKMLFKYR